MTLASRFTLSFHLITQARSDGTIPTSSSTQYSGPISVTGIEGQTVTTTIKAIAVDGGNVSAVATFQYTIKLPAIVTTYTVTVTGGTFSKDVSEYCAEGFVVEKTDAGYHAQMSFNKKNINKIILTMEK